MRLHSNVIGEFHIRESSARAGTAISVLRKHGSRSRAYAFEVQLSGSGRQGGAYGNLPGKSATWDEYGIFLAALYRVDPAMRVDGGTYESAEHFHWATGDRYRTLLPADAELRHKWQSVGASVGDSYWVWECNKCGATLRPLQRGWTFAMLNSEPEDAAAQYTIEPERGYADVLRAIDDILNDPDADDIDRLVLTSLQKGERG